MVELRFHLLAKTQHLVKVVGVGGGAVFGVGAVFG